MLQNSAITVSINSDASPSTPALFLCGPFGRRDNLQNLLQHIIMVIEEKVESQGESGMKKYVLKLSALGIAVGLVFSFAACGNEVTEGNTTSETSTEAVAALEPVSVAETESVPATETEAPTQTEPDSKTDGGSSGGGQDNYQSGTGDDSGSGHQNGSGSSSGQTPQPDPAPPPIRILTRIR